VKEISIGEFARRSRLSLKALRLYDERGVLVPSRVDQASGYRYYDTAQLDEARLVVMMRQLQLPLAAIKEMLACDPVDAAERIAHQRLPLRPHPPALARLRRDVPVRRYRVRRRLGSAVPPGRMMAVRAHPLLAVSGPVRVVAGSRRAGRTPR
jgi:DNA-binding transcriptional MerR regulator